MTGYASPSTNADYLARLERVKAGGIGTKQTIFVGMDEMFQMPQKANRQGAKSKGLAGNSVSFFSIVGALLLGLLAVCLARYLRFRVFPGIDLEGQLDLIANGGLGMIAGFLLTQMFRLSGKEHLAAQSVGVLAAICTLHNLVHWFPKVSEALFSPAWVNGVLTTTEPNSILFRGVYFVVGA